MNNEHKNTEQRTEEQGSETGLLVSIKEKRRKEAKEGILR
jgi:hypothetical protein